MRPAVRPGRAERIPGLDQAGVIARIQFDDVRGHRLLFGHKAAFLAVVAVEVLPTFAPIRRAILPLTPVVAVTPIVTVASVLAFGTVAARLALLPALSTALLATALLALRLPALLPVLTTILAVLAAVLATVLTAILLILLLAGFLFGRHFARRLAQKAGVMLGMLQEILGGDAVVGQLRIAGKEQVLLDDLLRRAAHLALGTR